MARRGSGAGGGGGYFVNDPRHGGDQHRRAAVWDPTELGHQAARAIEKRGALLERGTSMPRDFAVASGRGSPSYSVEARPNGKAARPLPGVVYHPFSGRATSPSVPPHLER